MRERQPRSEKSGFGRCRSGSVSQIFAFSLVPLVGFLGFAVDYSSANQLRTQLNQAADAAALSAVAPSVTSDDGQRKAVAEKVFRAQAVQVAGTTIDEVKVEVRKVVSTYSATVTYKARVKTAFANIIGVSTIDVAGDAVANGPNLSYVDFHMALDISQSMAIAATPEDIVRLQSLTGGCMFGCHTPNGGLTNYDIAHSNGVRLRIDVLRDTTNKLLDMATASPFMPNQFRVGLHTIGLTAKTLIAPSSNYASMRGTVNALDIQTDNGPGSTYFNVSLPLIREKVGIAGSGGSSGDPKKFLFIVTDGVQNVTNPGGPYGRVTSPFQASLCDSIKANGVTVAVLRTRYIPVPTDPVYAIEIAPIFDQIAPAMKACASPDYYFEATYAPEIESAMQTVFRLAFGKARLTQ